MGKVVHYNQVGKAHKLHGHGDTTVGNRQLLKSPSAFLVGLTAGLAARCGRTARSPDKGNKLAPKGCSTIYDEKGAATWTVHPVMLVARKSRTAILTNTAHCASSSAGGVRPLEGDHPMGSGTLPMGLASSPHRPTGKGEGTPTPLVPPVISTC
jgi:hypothetical protein